MLFVDNVNRLAMLIGGQLNEPNKLNVAAIKEEDAFCWCCLALVSASSKVKAHNRGRVQPHNFARCVGR